LPVFVIVLGYRHDIAGQDWIGEPGEGVLGHMRSLSFYVRERMTNFVLSLLLVQDASHPL
jgi:hypothetical protein